MLAQDKATEDRLRRYDHWLEGFNLSQEASDASVQALVAAVRNRYLDPALMDMNKIIVHGGVRYAQAAARRHGVPFVLEVNSPLALEKAGSQPIHSAASTPGMSHRGDSTGSGSCTNTSRAAPAWGNSARAIAGSPKTRRPRSIRRWYSRSLRSGRRAE